MILDNQSHTEQALARLPSQFINSTNLRNLVSINSDRAQDLNDELIKILNGRSVNDAVGKQLDNIATIFNLTRVPGETDIVFRARILAETAALARSGEPEHIIESYIVMTEAGSVFYAEIYPGGVQVTAHVLNDTFSTQEDTAIVNAMNNVRAGGIDIILIIAPETDYMMFCDVSEVDANGNGPIDESHGLGSIFDSDGGQLSRVLVADLPLIPLVLSLSGETLMLAGEPTALAGYFETYI